MTPEERQERRRLQARARYAADPERRREVQRAWRAAHPNHNRDRRLADPEKHRARDKAYRQSDPEKTRARAKAYAEANPEKVAAKALRWRLANLERSRENKRKWLEANPGKRSEYEAKRRAKRAAAKSIEHVDYAAIVNRDRSICHLCRRRVAKGQIHIDHILPLSQGGEHVAANLAVAHASCNLRKGSRPANDQLRLVG